MAIGPFAEADAVLAEVNRDHGTGYVLAGALSGGFQGGAWWIVGPDGGSAVLKWSEARGTWAQVVLAAQAKVAKARQYGYPTAAWVAAGLRALALLERLGPVRLPAGDLVHGDLNVSNVLVAAGGKLVGIVDIEALGAGCRAIDYAALWHSSADDGDGGGLSLVRAAAGRAAGSSGFAVCALWIALEYIRFGADRDGAVGSARAVAAAVRRLDRLEVPQR
jgi:hypothetical protein